MPHYRECYAYENNYKYERELKSRTLNIHIANCRLWNIKTHFQVFF